MNGGPSQTDTFDLKPGHANGGPYKPIDTSVAGVQISEHLPKIAQQMQHLAIIRSMATKEADHDRATYHLRTGYVPQASIQFPAMGSLVAKELGDENAALPNFVSIAPSYFSATAGGAGFLGPQYAPLVVGNGNFFAPNADPDQILKVQDLLPPKAISGEQRDARIDLLTDLQKDFVARNPGTAPQSHLTAYERAARLMRTDAAKAFDFKEEPAALRDAYGRNLFGQGCLLARRLVERGVPFVEVSLSNAPGVQGGWDTHQQNFEQVKSLSGVLDPAWATLMTDLKDRGLLDTTLIVWMGEFGRTPKINQDRGRDHFPNAWTAVLGGGGIKGGQAHGKTSPDGMTVADKPVPVPDLMATIAKALGIDPTKQNMSNVGRPIRIADAGSKPIEEVLA
jgi:hypothetical protein